MHLIVEEEEHQSRDTKDEKRHTSGLSVDSTSFRNTLREEQEILKSYYCSSPEVGYVNRDLSPGRHSWGSTFSHRSQIAQRLRSVSQVQSIATTSLVSSLDLDISNILRSREEDVGSLMSSILEEVGHRNRHAVQSIAAKCTPVDPHSRTLSTCKRVPILNLRETFPPDMILTPQLLNPTPRVLSTPNCNKVLECQDSVTSLGVPNTNQYPVSSTPQQHRYTPDPSFASCCSRVSLSQDSDESSNAQITFQSTIISTSESLTTTPEISSSSRDSVFIQGKELGSSKYFQQLQGSTFILPATVLGQDSSSFDFNNLGLSVDVN
jgi:hypothetical protein